ncbi:10705_t:CDS:10 [Diversispora eburnea]|uniref:10705_t:CDS:1 n=1 Tax=Diversispora eburnea TaxID=1213867 RepID=A0A9N8V085_9GLOM|nr:10705_t:CDS:10 [Diversispora eburnea]
MYVHRCRFVDFMPAAINALAFTPPTTQPLLACGRANGNIEIWNPQTQWNLEKTIPGEKNTSVEALTWVHQTNLSDTESKPPRLFSGSSNGMIIEWDTTTLRQKKSNDSYGGAIWCLKNNYANTLLVVGCEDGSLCTFDIEDEELVLIHKFVRNNSKIMSLAWDHEDEYIFAGSSDGNIVQWDMRSKRIIQRMTVDVLKGQDTIVWAINVLHGDSLGHICFWDRKTGTVVQKFKAHDADVLCLVTNREGSLVVSSGVDRKCNLFRIVDQKAMGTDTSKENNNKSDSTQRDWILVGFRRSHLHDVRSIALLEDQFFVSGGVDTEMNVYSYNKFLRGDIKKLPYIPQKPLICISKSKRLLMYRNDNQIKLWELGEAILPDSWKLEQIPRLDLVKPQKAILEMSLKESHYLTASAISEDGEWIAVANTRIVKVFKIQEHVSHQLLFTPDGTKLLIVYVDSIVAVADLKNWQRNEIIFLKKFNQHACPTDDDPIATVISIAVSGDGKLLATGDLCNRINIYDLENLEYYTSLPKYGSTHTTLSFHLSLPILVVTLASNEFFIFDVKLKKLTDWSQKYSQNLPKEFLKLENKIIGCSFNPEKNAIILWADNYLCLIDFDKCNEERPLCFEQCNGWQKKSPIQQKKGKKLLNEHNINFQLVQRYQPLMFVDFISSNTLVIVERPFTSILENLPPSFYKAQYGT